MGSAWYVRHNCFFLWRYPPLPPNQFNSRVWKSPQVEALLCRPWTRFAAIDQALRASRGIDCNIAYPHFAIGSLPVARWTSRRFSFRTATALTPLRLFTVQQLASTGAADSSRDRFATETASHPQEKTSAYDSHAVAISFRSSNSKPRELSTFRRPSSCTKHSTAGYSSRRRGACFPHCPYRDAMPCVFARMALTGAATPARLGSRKPIGRVACSSRCRCCCRYGCRRPRSRPKPRNDRCDSSPDRIFRPCEPSHVASQGGRQWRRDKASDRHKPRTMHWRRLRKASAESHCLASILAS